MDSIFILWWPQSKRPSHSPLNPAMSTNYVFLNIFHMNFTLQNINESTGSVPTKRHGHIIINLDSYSTAFLIHYSLIIQSFDAVCYELLRALLSKARFCK
jgi:hypothetical protein